MKIISEAESLFKLRKALLSRIVEDCKSAGGYHAELKAWQYVFPQAQEDIEDLRFTCEFLGMEVEELQRRMRKLKDGPAIAPTHKPHQHRRSQLRRSVAA